MSLLDHHRAMLEASAISDHVIEQRGYFSAEKKVDLEALGFPRFQRIVPALVLPSFGAGGEITNYQARPDQPRIDAERGRQVKYETVAGSTVTLDVPPPARALLGNPLHALWITEGIKKGDALASHGVAVVALLGVWNWKTPDWDRVSLVDRQVRVALDNDVMVNPNVYAALEQLGAFLAARGALVTYVYLPLDGGKVGVDDYLAADHTIEDLHALAEPELRPRPSPKDGAAKPAMHTATILAAIEQYLERFVIYPSEERHELAALVLWVAHTWAIDAYDVTPYGYIRSAEKGSGKTRALETLHPIVRRPLRASSISAAAVYQAVEARCPTLMIDEADAIFTSKTESAEALRGVLNGGNRRGSPVLRGSQDGELREYDVFSPKMLAGIDTGRLPETVRDRAIVIGLKKKLRSERVERFYLRDVEEQTERAREQLGLWADENLDALREFRTGPVPEISERLEEAWEPLLAIAALAGGDWPRRARGAAIALAKADLGGDVGYAHQLLAAIREVFEEEQDAIRSKALAERVNDLEEYGFGGWKDGKGIDARGIANLLRRYEITSTDIRFGEGVFKGYERSQFEDTWKRHLDSEEDTRDEEAAEEPQHPQQGNTPSMNGSAEPNPAVADDGRPSATHPQHRQSRSQSEESEPCCGVADVADGDRGDAHAHDEWEPAAAEAFLAAAKETFPGSVETEPEPWTEQLREQRQVGFDLNGDEP